MAFNIAFGIVTIIKVCVENIFIYCGNGMYIPYNWIYFDLITYFLCIRPLNSIRISQSTIILYLLRDKDVITPAPWYTLGGIGMLWAKYVSNHGTYWQERDALVEGVVEKYFQNPENSNKNRE